MKQVLDQEREDYLVRWLFAVYPFMANKDNWGKFVALTYGGHVSRVCEFRLINASDNSDTQHDVYATFCDLGIIWEVHYASVKSAAWYLQGRKYYIQDPPLYTEK